MTGGPDTISWLRLVLACVVVFAMLSGLGLGLKFFKSRGLIVPGFNVKDPAALRLKVVESLSLDLRRRLLIVRCDDKEHLLLLGEHGDVVVDTRLDTNQISSASKLGHFSPTPLPPSLPKTPPDTGYAS